MYDIRTIESKFIENPILFTDIMWKRESPEIELFLELFNKFIKNEQKFYGDKK